jgi:hypothetical protein
VGEQQYAALMAVSRALTQNEVAAILARSSQWPGMDGAGVADVLDMTVDYDEFLSVTEPFHEAHHAELGDNYGTVYALHALILLRQEPTVDTVRALLVRAGLAEGPYDPVPDLAQLVCWARRDPNGRHPSFIRAVESLARHDVTGAPDVIEARLRALLEKRQ